MTVVLTPVDRPAELPAGQAVGGERPQSSARKTQNLFGRIIIRHTLRALMTSFLLILRLARRLGPHKRQPANTGSIVLVTGTFHAESWARAHICPLAASR